MGIILDSSVIISAERRGHTVRQILEQVKAVQGEIEIGVSVVTIAELVHGAYRTKTQAPQQRRLEFIERLSSDVPVHPVTLAIARLAGRIEGQQEAIGVQFAFEDLLIGAALHLGYEVVTLNVRDFKRIPGLSVIQLRTINRQRDLPSLSPPSRGRPADAAPRWSPFLPRQGAIAFKAGSARHQRSVE